MHQSAADSNAADTVLDGDRSPGPFDMHAGRLLFREGDFTVIQSLLGPSRKLLYNIPLTIYESETHRTTSAATRHVII